MILSYTNENFPPLIASGIKIHSLRRDKSNRWKPGMKIQHWMYSPRHIHIKGSHPVLTEKEYYCKGLQQVLLSCRNGNMDSFCVIIDGREMTDEEIETLAVNDGFDTRKQMCNWFLGFGKNNITQTWSGKIIHWTDLRY